jgi:amidohydrolase
VTVSIDPHSLERAVAFRRALHAEPELSGEEERTAAAVVSLVAGTNPSQVLTGLGGHGVAAVYDSGRPGPTVLLRCELDGLPIEDTATAPWRSTIAGKGHQCGHDGHMATLALLAMAFGERGPARGRVVLMFQPAEETGAGARAVVADPAFAAIAPDISFAWHNMPGLPFGEAWLAPGVVNCASRGMRIAFSGKTSHAAAPEHGVSPMPALARLMPALAALGPREPGGPLAMATVTHAALGAAAFGVSPGAGEVWATLRTLTDAGMDDLVARATALAEAAAADHCLGVSISFHEVFAHVENAPAATAELARAMDALGVKHSPGRLPFRASEDFGIFGHGSPSAMVFIGAGETHPSLHNPDYDFPDGLIPIAASVLERAARQRVG